MRCTFFLALLVLFAASPAAAQIDIDMSFDPGEAAPGDMVTFSGSLISDFDTDIDAEFVFSASFGEHDLGPMTVELPVCAGQNLEFSVPVWIPWSMPAGEMSMTLTVNALGMTDTATASLMILGDSKADPGPELSSFASDFVFNFSCGGVPNGAESIGSLKSAW